MISDLVDDSGGHPIHSPEECGLDRDSVLGLLARARREVDDGLLPSCQVALAHGGAVVATRTFGSEPTSRYVTYSCTKALTAGAVWRVLGDGLVDRGTRVADVVPAFAAHGKGAVTVEHLLTHTAGFPDAPMTFDEWRVPSRRLLRFRAWELQWEPGTRFVYHGTSAHWVLAQVIESVTGMDFRDYVRREITEPLGLRALQLGTPPDDQADVLDAVPVGEPLSAEDLQALGGDIGLDIASIGSSQADLLTQNSPEARAVGQPGGGAIGRAADLALYYQALLTNPGDMWDPDVLSAGTAEVVCHLPDPMIGVSSNRTLGLLVAGSDGHAMMRGFGRSVSPRAFGHMGAGGQVAWADPASGISFAYLTNGLDRDPVRMGARSDAVSTRAGRTAALT